MGRRISKTVGSGTQTQYLYDGANAVQETVGSTVNPILVGLNMDERFARNDASGRAYFLTDALNSTIALTSTTGAIQNTYSYDPYGNTSQSGTGFTNPYQYTGREADTAGLYYYRARYYSPMMGSFISEDPARFAGGQLSFYGYAGGDPLDFSDPQGLAGLNIVHGVPPGSVLYIAPDGEKFYAPPSANFCAEEAAGKNNGKNPWAMGSAVGQNGQFDYQRSGGNFYPAYTNAANYGVGVYMYGAGFSEWEMDAVGGAYSFFNSSNANAASQTKWWHNGWQAASSGSFGCTCGK